MEFYNKNNNLSKQAGILNFNNWISENKQLIETYLIDSGINFINEQAESLKNQVTNLVLDDRWHYIDKPTKKQSYRGQIETNSQGIPYLNLTYFTFRHGKFSVRFNSKEVLKDLWKNNRHLTIKKTILFKPSNKLPSIPEPKIDVTWINHDLNEWQTMPATGISHYLKRKGLGDVFIPGIRFQKNHIAIAITDTNKTFHGLQRIYNDGSKRFTKGLSKKGHFSLIGDTSLPPKPQTLHVCEGMATAMSIHLATGEPIICALDAFNLLPVCRNLKRHYPKVPILIWADNDWQKANKKTKQGRIIGNTGLIQANRTAFKLRNALVCSPDFSLFPAEQIKTSTDFNDLHQIAGLESIQNATPQKPDISFALWHELHQYTQHAHGVLSPSQFSKGLKHTYSNRYLSQDIFKKEGVHLVRSAIGTGKTAVVEHLVKQNPNQSILFTTHLISLVESAAQRLELVSYNDCDNYDLQMEHRLAICLNSLGKLTAEGPLKAYDIVIIDEVEQVLARLTTSMEQKPLIFSVLRHLMTHAKTLICLDAHLSQSTVQMIQRFCSDKPVTVHFNQFEPGHGREVLLHENAESIQMTAMKVLEQNKTVYLAFNSKKEAYKTYSAFTTAWPEKKGLYISSDNTGDAENQAFFNNVNRISQNYDYIICTPSVSTGVSIDNNHFDFVGGVFTAQVNTANDCMQALGRVRNHKTLHVYCEKRLGFKSLNPEVISAKWSATHHHDLNLMNLDEATGARILLNPDYEHLVLRVTQARNVSFNNFYEQFSLLALHDGMRLSYFDMNLDTSTQKQLKQFKNACIEQDASQISLAQLPINAAQLIALANKPRKTMDDTRQHKKHQLIEFYNLSEKDTSTIQAMAAIDNEGRFKKQLLSLELALGDSQLAKQRFLEQLGDNTQFSADLTSFASLQQLYKQLLTTLRLSNTNNLLSTEDYQYTKEIILNSPFIKWIEEHRPVLQGLISLPSTQQVQRDPIRFISTMLARLGLKQKRVGRAENGVYHLDAKRISFLNSLMIRRMKGVSGISLPLDTSACTTKEPSTMDFFVDTFNKIRDFFTKDSNYIPLLT